MSVKMLSSINGEIRGSIFAGLSGMLFGLMGYFGTRVIDTNIPVITMLFWRFVIASLWIAGAFYFSKKSIQRPIEHENKLWKVVIAIVGSYSLGSLFYFLASRYIGTGIAMVIFFSFPVFVIIFSSLAARSLPPRLTIVSMMIVMIGLFLLKGNDHLGAKMIGIVLAVMAAFCYAFYVYDNNQHAKSFNPTVLTFITCVGNTLVYLLLSLIFHQFKFPTWNAWFYITMLGIFATALPIQFLLYALKYIPSVKASIISVLEPVVTITVGVWFLNESMTSLQLLGMIIVLSGAILTQFEQPEKLDQATYHER